MSGKQMDKNFFSSYFFFCVHVYICLYNLKFFLMILVSQYRNLIFCVDYNRYRHLDVIKT